MPLKRGGYLFLAAVATIASFVSILPFFIEYEEALDLLVRLLALNGFLFLSIATIMTPFLKEVTETFGMPFLRVHHVFAAVGLALVTLHPVAYAVQTLDLAVFVPRFESWYAFWFFGGRIALIVIYAAFVAALVRRNIPKHWRKLHALMYVALFFGIVHANLSGMDFSNVWVSVVFNVLFAASVVAFVVKRLRYRRFVKQAGKQ